MRYIRGLFVCLFGVLLLLLCLSNQEVVRFQFIPSELDFFYQKGLIKSTRSTIILSIIDFYWTEHLERMNYIRETINWRSYGQQNPLIEYNTEAFNSFKLMFEEIQRCMLYYSLNNAINY